MLKYYFLINIFTNDCQLHKYLLIMNIIQIKNIHKIFKSSINNINQQIIIRDCKLNFNGILYGFIFKCMNNLSYQDISSQINLDFIKRNINTTISKTAFVNKKCYTK